MAHSQSLAHQIDKVADHAIADYLVSNPLITGNLKSSKVISIRASYNSQGADQLNPITVNLFFPRPPYYFGPGIDGSKLNFRLHHILAREESVFTPQLSNLTSSQSVPNPNNHIDISPKYESVYHSSFPGVIILQNCLLTNPENCIYIDSIRGNSFLD